MATIQTFDFHPNMESMAGGSEDSAIVGQMWSVLYTGPVPDVGDTVKILVDDGEVDVLIEAGGDITSDMLPSFAFTYHNKEYILDRSRAHFSAIADPTIYVDPEGIGNGYVDMDNQTKVPEDLMAIATFQGKLAFLARRSIQIWLAPEDPNDWEFIQALENIGTIAKDSVRSTGNIDVIFLSDVGIASIRAREVTGNAYPDDLGTAIAKLVKAKVSDDPNGGANACAVIEPTTGQYWLFVKDTIFVLSYFESSKVLAWSQYEPTDSFGNIFVPEKFVVFNGQVFCRAGSQILAYGGSDKETYDSSQPLWETPWLDLKTPGIIKTAFAINAALSGVWKIYGGMDADTEVIDEPPIWDSHNKHTYDKGIAPMIGRGSHVKFRGVGYGTQAAIFSSIVFHYSLDEEN